MPEPTDPDATARDEAPATGRTGWWRPVVASVLVVVAAVLAPLAVVASWAEDQIGDTDRYLATVAPLADDPDVQDAVIALVTDRILERLDVQARTDEALDALADRGLPPRVGTTLSSLGAPLEAQVRDFVEDAVARLVRSEEFASAWSFANSQAHTQMVAVLTGKGGSVVDTSGGVVSVRLATVVAAVKERLTDRGFALAATIPEVDAQFTIFESADVARAQTGFRLLGAVSAVLPWLALLALAGAVAVARSRRRTLVAGTLAVAGSMVLLGLALNLGRVVYLDAVPADSLPAPAAAAIFEALVHFIRLSLRSVLVLFLVVALVAWVSGPGTQPTAVRRVAGRGVAGLRAGSARAGIDTGPFGATLHQYRTQVRVGIAAVALLVYVMAAHPTGRFTAVVAGIALLVLLVAEVLARPASASVAIAGETGGEAGVDADVDADVNGATGAPRSGA